MIFSGLCFPFRTNEWLSQNSQELDLSIWSKVSLVQPIEGECFVSDVKARRGVCQSEGALFKGSHAAVSWLTRHLVYNFKDFLVGPQEWLFIKPLACSCGTAAEKNSHLASKLRNWLVTSSWARESGWGLLAHHTFSLPLMSFTLQLFTSVFMANKTEKRTFLF